MANIATSLTQLVGKTPLLELKNIEKEYHLTARLLAKLESFNPAGSVKDRVALKMIEDAEAQGRLTQGATVIEPTSGNTGIGLCAICAVRGYRAVIVMPDSMSQERMMLMRAYGAQLVLTDGKDGMAGAIARARELQAEIPGSIIAGQFENPANPQAHYETTGPELFADTDGDIDFFVAGVGTGGTITGTGRYLKEAKPQIKIVAVEPADSAVLSGKEAGAHPLQGIGAGFVPAVLDTKIYDEIITVTGDQAYKAGKALARKEGLLCGISAGAALHAAIAVAARTENAGKTVVVLLPDTGDRYLSTALFQD
jgi:cysteine synthase A